MNPCPCGHFGDPEKACTCSPSERARYVGRLSGPLMDRIDLVVQVPRLTVEELTRVGEGEASERVRSRVQTARERMMGRQGERNSLLSGALLREHTALSAGAQAFIGAAASRLGLTGRGYDRVLRVARTVADLAGCAAVSETHLAEAVSFRPRELA